MKQNNIKTMYDKHLVNNLTGILANDSHPLRQKFASNLLTELVSFL